MLTFSNVFASDSVPLVRPATLDDLAAISSDLGLKVTLDELPDYLGRVKTVDRVLATVCVVVILMICTLFLFLPNRSAWLTHH